MLKGTSEEVTVVSDPNGADVIVNEQKQGTTPVTVNVPSKEDLNITVAKAGYQPQDLQDPTSIRWGYETWAFLEFVIPMVVDLSDGAAWGHDHLTMTAHLEKNQAIPAASASETAPASPFAAPPVASAESAPVTAPAPLVYPDAVAAAPVLSPAAVPSASAMTQQPVGSVPGSGPAPTTPE